MLEYPDGKTVFSEKTKEWQQKRGRYRKHQREDLHQLDIFTKSYKLSREYYEDLSRRMEALQAHYIEIEAPRKLIQVIEKIEKIVQEKKKKAEEKGTKFDGEWFSYNKMAGYSEVPFTIVWQNKDNKSSLKEKLTRFNEKKTKELEDKIELEDKTKELEKLEERAESLEIREKKYIEELDQKIERNNIDIEKELKDSGTLDLLESKFRSKLEKLSPEEKTSSSRSEELRSKLFKPNYSPKDLLRFAESRHQDFSQESSTGKLSEVELKKLFYFSVDGAFKQRTPLLCRELLSAYCLEDAEAPTEDTAKAAVAVAVRKFYELCGEEAKLTDKLKKSLSGIASRISRSLWDTVSKFFSRELAKLAHDKQFLEAEAKQANVDPHVGFYKELEFDYEAALRDSGGDETATRLLKAEIEAKILRSPSFKQNRLYHLFHFVGKEFRKKYLKLDGENLEEVYDITNCDLLMHAIAIMEKAKSIGDAGFISEAKAFYNEVRSDRIRKRFGVGQNGKCKGRVKLAFKIVVNGHKKEGMPCLDTLVGKISRYIERNYPNVWSYFKHGSELWKEYMRREFELVSVKLFKKLTSRGYKMLSVHDAVYMKKSEALSAEMIDKLIFC